MRFLLKPSSPPTVGTAQVLATRLRAAEPAPASVRPPGGEASAPQNDISAGKTWAQQCGTNCGCVLRFEAQLFECPSSSSPTIVRANYHAKRVMATASGKENNCIHLKPLTNQRSQPILTSCTCPTLHHIAKKAVQHLNGKTLAQIRNEMNLGMVGTRSSVAHRHTVLRECVLPIIVGCDSKKFGIAKKESTKQNAFAETNSTQQHFHCYDLVEGSLLSMIHERIPSPRKENYAEYSPTLGEYFRMHSYSGRKQSTESMGDEHQVGNASEVENEFSFIHEASNNWQRGSPSSFFLFGDRSSTSTSRIFIQHLKDSISDRLLGNEIKKEKTEKHRPTTSYLKLLDMYGIENSKLEVGDNISSIDDWLEFVDRNNYHQGGLA